MIEISVMEMALIVLNIIGWAGYFHQKEQHNGARRFINALLHDSKLRESVVKEVAELEKRST